MTHHTHIAAIREIAEYERSNSLAWKAQGHLPTSFNGLAGQMNNLLEHLTALEYLHTDAWQDISTAPKDGTRFLAVVMNGMNRWVQVLKYSPPEDENDLPDSFRSPDGAWYGKQCVTHWKPLPVLPPITRSE